MPKQSMLRTIIDKDIIISILTNKEWSNLKHKFYKANIELVFTKQYLFEIQFVAKRNEYRKFYELEQLKDLIDFFHSSGKEFVLREVREISCDPEDDFLITLVKISKADFLVSDDSDLSKIKKIGRTAVISMEAFKKILDKQF